MFDDVEVKLEPKMLLEELKSGSWKSVPDVSLNGSNVENVSGDDDILPKTSGICATLDTGDMLLPLPRRSLMRAGGLLSGLAPRPLGDTPPLLPPILFMPLAAPPTERPEPGLTPMPGIPEMPPMLPMLAIPLMVFEAALTLALVLVLGR